VSLSLYKCNFRMWFALTCGEDNAWLQVLCLFHLAIFYSAIAVRAVVYAKQLRHYSSVTVLIL
jgi:hypothetical protein